MADHADLTITLNRLAQNQYWAQLHYTLPDGKTEQSPASAPVRFDFEALRIANYKPELYGSLLKDGIFNPQPLREYYLQSVPAAGGGGLDLRLRMLIDRSALELHALRWETLRDPDDDEFLALIADQPFSRFLYSSDWRQVELRQKGELRALIVVANPSSLKQGITLFGQKLAEVDVEGEVDRAKTALNDLPVVDVLESQENHPGKVTLDYIEKNLSKGYDILYLVCHGALLPGDPDVEDSPQRPYLILEKDDGSYDRTDAGLLVEYIAHLPAEKKPRLVVLASCQSGGQGKVPDTQKYLGEEDEDERSYDRGALSAIGPRLVDVGVPAVVAMQDNVKMETVKKFMPAFFINLLQSNGQVDQAMAEARNQIKDREDWWVPVLYLRLRGGQLWYEPGFADSSRTEFLWTGIIDSIDEGRCIPILGTGLLESMIGSREQIAQSWAEKHGYPLAPHEQKEIHQVAQYLSTRLGTLGPRNALEKYMKSVLREKCKELGLDTKRKDMPTLLHDAAKKLRDDNEYDPYRVLASLPFKIYINANPDNLIEQALIDQGKNPQVLHYCWRTSMRNPEAVNEKASLEIPSVKNPLVYYLFGKIDDRKTWVLTEDDYFEYLMWMNKPDNNMPDLIKTAWINDPLLFLGFKINDWNFRLLYRSILNEDRRKKIGPAPEYHSIAVQIQPGDDNLHPEGVRNYLTQFFPSNMFDLYWGSAENFLETLWDQWQLEMEEDE